MIGIDTAVDSGFDLSGGGNGFAIPINRALAIVKQIETGRSTASVHVGPTWLLIGISVGSPERAAATSGAFVSGVLSGSPADKAGLRTGDVITSLAGHAISSPTALVNTLLHYPPGAALRVRWSDQDRIAHNATIRPIAGTAPVDLGADAARLVAGGSARRPLSWLPSIYKPSTVPTRTKRTSGTRPLSAASARSHSLASTAATLYSRRSQVEGAATRSPTGGPTSTAEGLFLQGNISALSGTRVSLDLVVGACDPRDIGTGLGFGGRLRRIGSRSACGLQQ